MRRLLASIVASSIVLSTALAHAKSPGYDPEQPVPVGYHVEEHPRIAMAITGGALVTTGAGFIIYGLHERETERRSYEAARAADPSYEGDAGFSAGTMSLYAGVAIAAVGAPFLIIGLTTKRSVLVRDNVAITPIATPSFGGLAVAATF